jgi:nucleoside-diphosphate-sugar epimerase
MMISRMTEHSVNVALVTGATGYIGGRLAHRLIDDGWSVRVLARNPDRVPDSLRSRAEVIGGDLANKASLGRGVRGVSVIFHCAANVNTWDSVDAYFSANVSGVATLLNVIAEENPELSRLVHVSTMDVYGFPKHACDEQSATAPSGFGYGDSKLIGESLVREFCDAHRIPYTIIRPANVIGPQSQFVRRIGTALTSGVMLTVDGGRANAGLVYIDNLVDYLVWAALSRNAIGQCYNVRDAYDATWAGFIRALRHGIGARGRVVDLPYGVADGVAWLSETFYRAFLLSREPLLHRLLVRIFGRTCGHHAEKIRSDSGLIGRVGFDEAMERSIRWFMEEGIVT